MDESKLNIAVLGSGAFGVALGYCAAKNGHNITLISRQENVVKEINEKRRHPSRLTNANYTLPQNVKATSNGQEALEKAGRMLLVFHLLNLPRCVYQVFVLYYPLDYIIHTVPVQYSRETLTHYEKWIGDTPIISASKGIETSSLFYMSQLVPDALKRDQKVCVVDVFVWKAV